MSVVIFLCSHTNNGAQRRNDLGLVHLRVSDHNVAVFKTAGSLHYCMVAVFELHLTGSKVIYLAGTSETDSHHVNGMLGGLLLVHHGLGKLRRLNIVLCGLGIVIRSDSQRIVRISKLVFNGRVVNFLCLNGLFFSVLLVGASVRAVAVSSVAVTAVISAVSALSILLAFTVAGCFLRALGNILFYSIPFGSSGICHKGKRIVDRASLYATLLTVIVVSVLIFMGLSAVKGSAVSFVTGLAFPVGALGLIFVIHT